MKKSVPRISKLHYCLNLARQCVQRDNLVIGHKDAYEVIWNYRQEEEELREVIAQRYTSLDRRMKATNGRYLSGITSELVSTLHRWKLLHKIGNVYQCSRDFEQMGREGRREAKEILLKKLLIYEPLFSRFLLTLRDSSLDEDDEARFGATYCGKSFMDKLETNPVSLDVLCDWGDFFDFSYDYKIEFQGKARRQVILTCYVSVISEIIEVQAVLPFEFEKTQVLNMTGWSRYKVESILHFLIKLGIIEKIRSKYYRISEGTFDFQELVALAKKSGVLLLDRGERSLLIEERVVEADNFKESVLSSYKGILAKIDVYAPISISIDDLRTATCKMVRISREVFDNRFAELYEQNKEHILLVGASKTMRRYAARRKHVISEKPLKYENQYFSFVTLIWEGIE